MRSVKIPKAETQVVVLAILVVFGWGVLVGRFLLS